MDAHIETAEAILERLIDRLHDGGRLRVWSLVITLFGDAIMPRGGEAPLASLQEIMARLHIEAGAVRTAMSRLASDGWVARARRGRNSFFRLDEHGRHAFDLATRRIYAPAPPFWDGTWTVAIARPGKTGNETEKLADDGFLPIGSGVFLLPRTTSQAPDNDALGDMLVIHGSSAEHPEMLRELFPSQAIADSYHALIETYQPFVEALEKRDLQDPLDAMAARLLLMHDWRRIVLRDPGLPAALLPQGWPGEKARALVRKIYMHLMPASESWADAQGLPSARDEQSFLRRFGGLSG